MLGAFLKVASVLRIARERLWLLRLRSLGIAGAWNERRFLVALGMRGPVAGMRTRSERARGYCAPASAGQGARIVALPISNRPPARAPGESRHVRTPQPESRTATSSGLPGTAASASAAARMARRAGKVMTLAAACAAGAFAVYVGIVSYLVPLHFALPLEGLLNEHYALIRPVILDARLRVVGMDFDERTLGIERRRATLFTTSLPPHWGQYAIALEDRHFGDRTSLRWHRGVDLLCLPAGALRNRGCSTLPMIAAKLLMDGRHKQRTGQLSTFRRKLAELGTAPAIVERFAPEEILRLVATHVSFAHGGGGDIVGVEAAAMTVFGKSAARISAAESAILAAAIRRPIVLSENESPQARARWDYLVGRARYAARLALSGSAQAAVLTELDSLQRVLPRPDTGLDEVAPPFGANANLITRTKELIGREWIEAKAEGIDHGVLQPGKVLGGVQLTIDAETNMLARHAFEQAIERIQAGMGCRLRVRLTAPEHDTRRCAGAHDDRAQVLAVLTDLDGRILNFYLSGDGADEPAFSGVAGRGESGGRYEWRREFRDGGSLAKLAAALLPASLGDAPDAAYCREYYQGRKGARGSTGYARCDAHGARLPAEQVFALSDNLALHWRLRQPDIEPSQLRALAEKLRLALPEDQPAPYAFAFGSVRAAPRTWHNLLLAVAQVLEGRRHGSGVRLIERAMPLAEAGARWVTAARPNPAFAPVREYLADASARTYLKAALSAPVQSGTLAFLRKKCSDLDAECLGKTGTAVIDSPKHGRAISDKYATGLLSIEGRSYTWFAMLRAPRPADAPLGTGIAGSDMLPVISILFDLAAAHARAGRAPNHPPAPASTRLLAQDVSVQR
jgi:hypothetical protein